MVRSASLGLAYLFQPVVFRRGRSRVGFVFVVGIKYWFSSF